MQEGEQNFTYGQEERRKERAKNNMNKVKKMRAHRLHEHHNVIPYVLVYMYLLYRRFPIPLVFRRLNSDNTSGVDRGLQSLFER